jgi:hypothetical protein
MEAIFGTLRTVTSLAAGTEIISDYPIPAGFSILLLIAGNETAITISEQTAKLVEGYSTELARSRAHKRRHVVTVARWELGLMGFSVTKREIRCERGDLNPHALRHRILSSIQAGSERKTIRNINNG